MKKLLLLLLLFVTSFNGLAQNTVIPDPNFEQALIDQNFDTGSVDGVVPTANINTITFLDVSNKGITDLTGVEAMSSLEDLRCNNNNLTKVDISQNNALLNIQISSNSLTELDISSNTALINLLCSGNSLTHLDVSSNIDLERLSCVSNKLSNLDLSVNKVLTELHCAGNDIIELDLSKNEELTILNCSNNDLNSLNIKNGNNLALTLLAENNPNLFCITADSSTLTFPNVDLQTHFNEDCTGLVYGYVPDDSFEQFLIDEGLDYGARNNYVEVTTSGIEQRTSIDISNLNIQDLTGIEYFTALTELICRGNQLSNLDLSKNIALTDLYCDSNQITELDLEANIALQYLDCSINQLIALNLNQNANLQGIVCSNNSLTQLLVKNGSNTNITAFVATNNPDLTCIEVDNASYSTTNWTDIDPASSFSEDCSVSVAYTDIPDNNFEQELIDLNLDTVLDGRVLTASIDTLTVLYVNGKDIASLTGIEDFVALTELRCDNNNLTTLDVSQNTALIFLNASSNQLTSLDVSQNTALSGLACDDNQLTSLDVSQNTALTTLRCENNQLTTLDLQQNLGLTSLYCNSNQLTSLNVSQNTALNYLVCSSNQLTSLDLNPALIGLDCKNNQLSSLDLSQNATFTTLDCSNNNLARLNVKNGNNSNVTGFFATDNPNLTCVQVDNAAYSTANWTDIDTTASFSEDCSVSVAMTYVPDDNFEQYLIDEGYDSSGVLNDSVPTASINTITNLNISGKNIADLTGIEDFAALTNLTCNNNLLPTLDLSQNTNLSYLIVNSNLLSTLNLNANEALAHLDCSSNSITALDLSANTSLTNLYAANNTMVELNLKNGNNNNVDEIIIHNNPNLTCVQVDDAAYSTANWTDIDPQTYFSEDCSATVALTYVPDDNFEQFLIDEGYDSSGILDDYVPTAEISTITILDVSNKNIASLEGIEDFVSLTELYCANNQLTTLDLGQNVQLVRLVCSDNLLTTLDISQNAALTHLFCNSNELQVLDVRQNTLLNSLNCENNLLTTLDVSQNNILENLICNQNRLTTIGLAPTNTLTDLECENNQLTSLDVSQNSELIYLKCSNNELTSLNVKNGNNTNFENFDSTNNPNLTCIQVDDAAYSTANWTDIDPATTFSEDCSVSVAMTYVPDDNFEQFLIDEGYDSSGILDDYVPTAEISTITILDVSNKNIDDLTGIEDFSALETLDCSENNLTILDISPNEALESLIFRNNQIESIDVSSNIVLTNLSGSYNRLRSLDVSQNTLLLNFRFHYNQLESLDLSQNRQLRNLGINGNQLTTLNLDQNVNLVDFDCTDNPLTSLSIKNGNNTIIEDFYITNSPDLTCVDVDDAAYSTANWTNIDPTTSFSEDCSATVALTYVPDDNFEQFLIDEGYDSTGILDDYVPTAEINAITVLDVSNKNIASLEGIEDFVALTHLNCDTNNLTDLDVTQNTAITHLSCKGNNLTTLDLTLNTNLISLSCGVNDLVDLNLSENVALTDLNCYGNQLTNLILARNPELTRVICYDNLLTDLNLTQNLHLVELSCHTNQIISLDLSRNTSLSSLFCGSNSLTSLNVKNGNNTNFENFDSTNNPNLTCVQVDDAAYSTANWTSIDSQTTFSEDCSDTTPPVITLNGANPQEIQLGDGYTELGATTDDGSTVVIDASAFVDAVGSYTIYYSATDTNGNVAVEVTRTVNVVETDTTPPVITLNGANPQEIQLGDGYTELGATTDDGSTVVIDATAFVDAVGSYIITYNATDANGNVATEVTRTVNVVEPDTTSPVITLNGANPQEIQLGDGYTELGATTDDGSTVVIDASAFVDAVGSYIIRYNATDANGNVATEVTRTVNVVETDTTPPVITLNGANPQEIQLGDGYTELGATTDDGSTVVIDASAFVDAIGSYIIRYNATDANGNVATEVTRTVNVVDTDTTAPVITLIGDNPQTINLGDGYTELGAVTDDGSTVVIDASAFVDAVGSYIITYNATDANGNVATEVTRTVNVVENDTTPPIITLIGDNPQEIQLGDGYTELGATTDDGSTVVIDASTFVDAVGSYVIYYNATDASGNVATEVTRTVNVVDTDTTAPVITLIGDNPQTINLGDGYTELGAVTDDGSTVVIDASAFVDTVGSYTIYYNATDASINDADEVTRTVNVVETDTTPPVITLNGANPQEIQLGDGYTELGATTDDGSTVVIDASAFVDAVGSYIITYNATDANGNVATEVTRTVNVVGNDTTPPIITLIGDNPQEIQLGDGYTELGATTDDGSTVVIDASTFVDAVGSYVIYYNATDASGNDADEVTRTVNVVGFPVKIPKAFSPNGDNKNDTWVIENIERYPNAEILIYNRWGAKVYEAKNYKNDWNGVSKFIGRKKLAIGSYLYILKLNDSKSEPIQGWIYINY